MTIILQTSGLYSTYRNQLLLAATLRTQDTNSIFSVLLYLLLWVTSLYLSTHK